MTKEFIFWVLMLLWLIFGLWWYWPVGASYGALGVPVLIFILFALLGWKVFGPPVKG